eukprot:TRINITY_DN2556_c0_g1_i2.p1 TRINITY_DN2556_c0_g1~~TRINITY_DN2556_c0_g1_i2.p1  ORF type:complete len:253 (+),score=69.15 TRINITY_DN2556_c0_g1_i2:79-837(+)
MELRRELSEKKVQQEAMSTRKMFETSIGERLKQLDATTPLTSNNKKSVGVGLKSEPHFMQSQRTQQSSTTNDTNCALPDEFSSQPQMRNLPESKAKTILAKLQREQEEKLKANAKRNQEESRDDFRQTQEEMIQSERKFSYQPFAVQKQEQSSRTAFSDPKDSQHQREQREREEEEANSHSETKAKERTNPTVVNKETTTANSSLSPLAQFSPSKSQAKAELRKYAQVLSAYREQLQMGWQGDVREKREVPK